MRGPMDELRAHRDAAESMKDWPTAARANARLTLIRGAILDTRWGRTRRIRDEAALWLRERGVTDWASDPWASLSRDGYVRLGPAAHEAGHAACHWVETDDGGRARLWRRGPGVGGVRGEFAPARVCIDPVTAIAGFVAGAMCHPYDPRWDRDSIASLYRTFAPRRPTPARTSRPMRPVRPSRRPRRPALRYGAGVSPTDRRAMGAFDPDWLIGKALALLLPRRKLLEACRDELVRTGRLTRADHDRLAAEA